MAGLTRAHFQALAEVFAEADKTLKLFESEQGWTSELSHGPSAREMHSTLLKGVADFCQKHNPGFQRERFYDVALNRRLK